MVAQRSLWRPIIALCLTILVAALVGVGIARLAQPRTSIVANNVAAVVDEGEADDGPSAAPTPLPTPVVTFFKANEPPPAPQATPLINESFDAPNERWITRRTDTASSAYVDGAYQLQLIDQTSVGVTQLLPVQSYRLSVDLQIAEGNAGLILFAVKPTTFYRLLFSPEERFALQLQDQVTGVAQNVIDWTPVPAPQSPAPATQHVVVERGQYTMRLYVNGSAIGEFALPEGDLINQYGFVLESASKRGSATFDNLVIGQTGQ